MTGKKTLSDQVREASRRPVPDQTLYGSHRDVNVERDYDDDLDAIELNPTHQEDFMSLVGVAAQKRK